MAGLPESCLIMPLTTISLSPQADVINHLLFQERLMAVGTMLVDYAPCSYAQQIQQRTIHHKITRFIHDLVWLNILPLHRGKLRDQR